MMTKVHCIHPLLSSLLDVIIIQHIVYTISVRVCHEYCVGHVKTVITLIQNSLEKQKKNLWLKGS